VPNVILKTMLKMPAEQTKTTPRRSTRTPERTARTPGESAPSAGEEYKDEVLFQKV